MKTTERYKNIVEDMIIKFMEKYWTDEEGYVSDCYLIGSRSEGQCGGPLAVNDEYFFSINEIYESLENDFDIDKILEWKDLEVETLGSISINFYNYCKFGITPSATPEELAVSEKAVDDARKLLEEEILKSNKLKGSV